jgi:hypothetical protein
MTTHEDSGMPDTLDHNPQTTRNPLDLLEELLTEEDWPYAREADDELVVDVGGGWCDYRMYFIWQPDLVSLQFCCQFDLTIPPAFVPAITELMRLMNDQIWLGHFILGVEDRTPMFRYTLMLKGLVGASPEQIEDLIEVALAECDRIFPAFQFILSEGKSAEEAFNHAILETVGEA